MLEFLRKQRLSLVILITLLGLLLVVMMMLDEVDQEQRK